MLEQVGAPVSEVFLGMRIEVVQSYWRIFRNATVTLGSNGGIDAITPLGRRILIEVTGTNMISMYLSLFGVAITRLNIRSDRLPLAILMLLNGMMCSSVKNLQMLKFFGQDWNTQIGVSNQSFVYQFQHVHTIVLTDIRIDLIFAEFPTFFSNLHRLMFNDVTFSPNDFNFVTSFQHLENVEIHDDRELDYSISDAARIWQDSRRLNNLDIATC